MGGLQGRAGSLSPAGATRPNSAHPERPIHRPGLPAPREKPEDRQPQPFCVRGEQDPSFRVSPGTADTGPGHSLRPLPLGAAYPVTTTTDVPRHHSVPWGRLTQLRTLGWNDCELRGEVHCLGPSLGTAMAGVTNLRGRDSTGERGGGGPGSRPRPASRGSWCPSQGWTVTDIQTSPVHQPPSTQPVQPFRPPAEMFILARPALPLSHVFCTAATRGQALLSNRKATPLLCPPC